MEKQNILEEQIKDLGFEIEKKIRRNFGTESEFARKTGRPKTSLNNIIKSLKLGKSCTLKTVIPILNDLELILTITPKER